MSKSDDSDDMLDEYKPEHFPKPFERGRYAQRKQQASNIVRIRPELSKAFPNEEAVNAALQSLLDRDAKSSSIASGETAHPHAQS